MMKVGEGFFSLIREFEGFRSRVYLCPAGRLTIGYGTLITPKTRYLKDRVLSREEAMELVVLHMEGEYPHILPHLPTLSQNQFDAVADFVYNFGSTTFLTSTLLRKIQGDKNDPRIVDEFLRWKYAGGKILEGLVRRRKAEVNLFFSVNR